MQRSTLGLRLTTPGQGIVLDIKLDDHCIYHGTTQGQEILQHDFEDQGQHTLSIIMSGKQDLHTVLSEHGEISQDACVYVTEFSLDGIILNDLLPELATYRHDFNGHGIAITDSFYGTMGCNGIMSIEFSSPVYMWLLEHT